MDTSLGNVLNPRAFSNIREIDPEGLGQTENQRTTGFLREPAMLVREPTRTESGWEYKGSLEAGGIGVSGDRNNAKFKEYRDLDREFGLYLNNFRANAEKPDEARYLNVIGGAVGQRDQYYGVTFGRYNDWRVKAFYSETPHTFTTTYRNLWSGTGSNSLTLNNLQPGGTTSAAVTTTNIRNAVMATPNSN